jgi:hypothetical protein
MKENNKSSKKQNPPNYISNKPKNLLEIQKENIMYENDWRDSKESKSIIIPKFRLGIDKNNNPIVTIDNIMHFMSQEQFDAFLYSIISIAQKMNPEKDYSEYIQ